METLSWILIISTIIFAALGIWGIRYPRSAKDWNKDRAETMSLFFSMMIFLVFFLLMWYVVGVIDWPDSMDLIIWSSIIIFLSLILAAIFLPKGTMMNWGKKGKKVKTADDDDD